jgi:hypothetical protein
MTEYNHSAGLMDDLYRYAMKRLYFNLTLYQEVAWIILCILRFLKLAVQYMAWSDNCCFRTMAGLMDDSY